MLCLGVPRSVSSAGAADTDAQTPSVAAKSPIEAGKYLVAIGGCTDCHSPGGLAGIKVPEAIWFTGSPVGFRGPWGTSYPSNLRLTVSTTPEDQFVKMMHTRNAKPPMPWGAVNAMSDSDVRAIYQYLKSLGNAGQPAPADEPPDQEPKTPYIMMLPQMPAAAADAKK